MMIFFPNIIVLMLQFVTKYFNDSKTPRALDKAPVANMTVPKSLLQQCHDTPVIAHTGKYAVIYKAVVNDQLVGIKVVPDEDKNNVTKMLAGLQLLGTIGSLVNPSVSKGFQYLQTSMQKEIDIKRELKWCRAINKMIKPHRFGARTIQPVTELCNKKCFVYQYENIPGLIKLIGADQTIVNQVGRRLSLMFFASLHKRSAILFGDMDINNFLYCPKKDEIVLLDFGCMSRIHTATQARLKNFHASMTNYSKLKTVMNEWGASDSLVRFVYAKVKPFFSENTLSFSNTPDMQTAVKDFSIQHCRIPPDILMTIRACNQLIDTLRILKAEFNIRDELLRLIAIKPASAD